MPTNAIHWAYGVTTVPERRNDLLPRTLSSLFQGGFSSPHLFIDGERKPYTEWDILPQVCRYPRIKAVGNFILSMWELLLRYPDADRYIIFQDDIVCCQNLRQYLERVDYRPKSFYNLYLSHHSEKMIPQGLRDTRVSHAFVRWFPSKQLCKGALAVMFDRETVTTLLNHRHLTHKVTNPDPNPESLRKRYTNVDGMISEALCHKRRGSGFTEYIHYPSLVQHTGGYDIVRKRNPSIVGNIERDSEYFWGEEFDALSLVPSIQKTST